MAPQHKLVRHPPVSIERHTPGVRPPAMFLASAQSQLVITSVVKFQKQIVNKHKHVAAFK